MTVKVGINGFDRIGRLLIPDGHRHQPVFPELTGKLNDHAVRVPLTNASITESSQQ